MILPTLDLEKKYWGDGVRIVVGIDEAGRGPLAGPVVAGAVFIVSDNLEKMTKEKEISLIRDSKTLSSKQREKAYELIVNNFPCGVGLSSHETIDRTNILQASFLAMKKAIFDLKRKISCDADLLLVDGRSVIPNISLKQKNIINGDRDIFSISAASIIAKVTRDRMMLEFHEKFPEYSFDRHKGYGTKLHFEMIDRHGICEIHRKSFAKSKLRD